MSCHGTTEASKAPMEETRYRGPGWWSKCWLAAATKGRLNAMSCPYLAYTPRHPTPKGGPQRNGVLVSSSHLACLPDMGWYKPSAASGSWRRRAERLAKDCGRLPKSPPLDLRPFRNGHRAGAARALVRLKTARARADQSGRLGEAREWSRDLQITGAVQHTIAGTWFQYVR